MKKKELEIGRISKGVSSIRQSCNQQIESALILGTGLGQLAEIIDITASINYSNIEGFPVLTAPNHAGRLVIGHLEGRSIAIMQGRLHLYEGWSAQDIAFPIRVLRKLGANQMIITNAAGALNSNFQPGDIMLITDHLNFTGQNPLIGKNDRRLGLRFPDMSNAYDKNFLKMAEVCLKKSQISYHRGIYAGISGPSLETSAERRFLSLSGADVVGMSTVIEVISAIHVGFKVTGISAITNQAVGSPGQQPDTLEEMLGNAAIAGEKIIKFLPLFLNEVNNCAKINNLTDE